MPDLLIWIPEPALPVSMTFIESTDSKNTKFFTIGIPALIPIVYVPGFNKY